MYYMGNIRGHIIQSTSKLLQLFQPVTTSEKLRFPATISVSGHFFFSSKNRRCIDYWQGLDYWTILEIQQRWNLSTATVPREGWRKISSVQVRNEACQPTEVTCNRCIHKDQSNQRGSVITIIGITSHKTFSHYFQLFFFLLSHWPSCPTGAIFPISTVSWNRVAHSTAVDNLSAACRNRGLQS